MEVILTNIGITKLASATPLDQLEIQWVRVGDGGGGYPPLDPAMTDLVNGVWAGPASAPIRDPANPAALIFETVIPATDGGFFIREVGLVDVDDDLIAIGQLSEIEKPTLASGSPITLTVRVRLVLSNESQTELIVTDMPFIDHQGLTNRDAADAHPISAVTGLSFVLGQHEDSIDDLYGNMLDKRQNLHELESPADARDNLGLGTAATKDAQTHADDSAPGRLMINGAYGLGGALGSSSGDLNSFSNTTFFRTNYNDNNIPDVPGFWNGVGVNVCGDGGYMLQILQIYDDVYFRTKSSIDDDGVFTWSGWTKRAHGGKALTDNYPVGKPGVYTGENIPLIVEGEFYLFGPNDAKQIQRIVVTSSGIEIQISEEDGVFSTVGTLTLDESFGPVINSFRPYATTAQAQAATSNDSVMTPLRVKDAFSPTIVSAAQRHFKIPGGPLVVVGSATIPSGSDNIVVTIPNMGSALYTVTVTPKQLGDGGFAGMVVSATSFRISRENTTSVGHFSYACYANV